MAVSLVMFAVIEMPNQFSHHSITCNGTYFPSKPRIKFSSDDKYKEKNWILLITCYKFYKQDGQNQWGCIYIHIHSTVVCKRMLENFASSHEAISFRGDHHIFELYNFQWHRISLQLLSLSCNPVWKAFGYTWKTINMYEFFEADNC